MAKSKSFFGQRRGSTKSLTFQVLRGMQITKDRVTEVANPQTSGQMPTRVSLAVVSKAAARLMPLIGMSFEGAGNAVDNRRRFQAENMRHMRQVFINSIPKGRNDRPWAKAAYGIPKGFAAIVPNEYIVAKGSLVTPRFFSPRIATNGVGSAAYQTLLSAITMEEEGYLFTPGTYTAQQFVNRIFGLNVNDQITFVGVCTEDGDGYVYNGINEIGYMTRFGEMISRRLVFTDPALNIEITESTTTQQVKDFLTSCVSLQDTDATLLQVLLGVLTTRFEDGFLKVLFGTIDGDALLGEKADNYTLRALGWFSSRLDTTTMKWRYSNCTLSLIRQPYRPVDEGDEENWYGVPYGLAVETYLKATTKTASDLYTQQGGDNDNLGF